MKMLNKLLLLLSCALISLGTYLESFAEARAALSAGRALRRVTTAKDHLADLQERIKDARTRRAENQ